MSRRRKCGVSTRGCSRNWRKRLGLAAAAVGIRRTAARWSTIGRATLSATGGGRGGPIFLSTSLWRGAALGAGLLSRRVKQDANVQWPTEWRFVHTRCGHPLWYFVLSTVIPLACCDKIRATFSSYAQRLVVTPLRNLRMISREQNVRDTSSFPFSRASEMRVL